MKARMIVMGSQMRYYPEPPPAPLVLMEEDGIICASSAEYGVRVDAASIEQVTPESLKQANGSGSHRRCFCGSSSGGKR
jgi:hypothetical protein